MKKYLALLLSVSLLFTQTAFDFKEKESVAASVNPNYSCTEEQLVEPFWKQDTMYNEIVTFVESDDGIYANTLFIPSEVLCLTDAALSKEYYPGVDFKWVEGTNKLEWIQGSSIPYYFKGELQGKASPDSDELVPVYSDWSDPYNRMLLGNVMYCISDYMYSHQLSVTYKYDRTQIETRGIVCTESNTSKLLNTRLKLALGEDLKVLFYGDSIFSGSDASSLYKRSPNMPTMSKLIKAELQRRTTGTVTLDNIAVGGWTTANGLQALSESFDGHDYSNAYQGYDLLILSFGMNDARTSTKSFRKSIKGIIKTIRAANPNLEVILVSCMNPNPDSTVYGNQQYFPEVLKEIAAFDKRTTFVDMFGVHASILNYKPFISTSGNNINHPNDWLIRVYAQNILEAIGEIKLPASKLFKSQLITNVFKLMLKIYKRVSVWKPFALS